MLSAAKKKVALLIFANSPEAERERKVVGDSDELFTLLTEHSLKLARQLQIPFFHFTEREQVGLTFGERYTNAIKKLFAQGYDGLITIGNDTPALNLAHLKTALTSLKNGRTVLGPSKDGGFYLLAISRTAFCQEELLSVSWNTNKVFTQMLNHLQARKQEIQVLQPLLDLDATSDIARIIAQYHIIPIGIHRILLRFQRNAKIEFHFPRIPYPLTIKGCIQNRGSPDFCF